VAISSNPYYINGNDIKWISGSNFLDYNYSLNKSLLGWMLSS
jgi:hypothetical protein